MLMLNEIDLGGSPAIQHAFAMFPNIRTEFRMVKAHQLLWQYCRQLIDALVARVSLRNNPPDSSDSLDIQRGNLYDWESTSASDICLIFPSTNEP